MNKKILILLIFMSCADNRQDITEKIEISTSEDYQKYKCKGEEFESIVLNSYNNMPTDGRAVIRVKHGDEEIDVIWGYGMETFRCKNAEPLKGYDMRSIPKVGDRVKISAEYAILVERLTNATGINRQKVAITCDRKSLSVCEAPNLYIMKID